MKKKIKSQLIDHKDFSLKPYSLKLCRGFTLTELLITSVLLTLLMIMGMMVHRNLNDSWQLAEAESRMQQHSRTAMMTITREIRQAARFVSVPPPGGVTYSYHIQFTIPEMDNSTGAATGNYKLIRYWYEQDTQTKIWSMKRAWKSNGTSPAIATITDFTDNATYLVREAAVVDPGLQSYFRQDPLDAKKILIRMVTATYKIRSDGQSTTQQEHVLSRVFRVETEVDLRNLDS